MVLVFLNVIKMDNICQQNNFVLSCKLGHKLRISLLKITSKMFLSQSFSHNKFRVTLKYKDCNIVWVGQKCPYFVIKNVRALGLHLRINSYDCSTCLNISIKQKWKNEFLTPCKYQTTNFKLIRLTHTYFRLNMRKYIKYSELQTP
jgi:hypothetical protein